MESQSQNTEFRNNTENFHQCIPYTFTLSVTCPDFINKDKQNFKLTIVIFFSPIIF